MESEKLKTKSWLAETPEGDYLVETKDGIFKLRDVEYDRIVKARKRGEKPNMVQECILSELIVGKDDKEEKIGELDILKFKGSSVMRLNYVMNEIMGVKDFLEQLSEQ